MTVRTINKCVCDSDKCEFDSGSRMVDVRTYVHVPVVAPAFYSSSHKKAEREKIM